MLNLDVVENGYLFGQNFDEQLSKIASAKQKSKSIFTGLQSKPNQTPYPQPTKRQGRGFLFARGGRGKQLFLKSVSSAESANTESTKSSSHIFSYRKVAICRKQTEFSTSRASSVFPD